MTMVQTYLRNGDTVQVVWLPQDMRVRENTVISLKGDRRKWKVLKQYKNTQLDSRLIRQDWKVGGLF